MPREIIVIPNRAASPEQIGEHFPGLSVGWNKSGWVQAHMFDDDAESTGDWSIVNLDRSDINRLIRTLRRARDAAFGADA